MERNNKLNKETIAYWILFAALLCLVSFLALYHLDVKYVDPWDEARHGVNAYEMLHGGSLFQNTYLRQADYYNLKPPLSMWMIMLSMQIFGNTVFALRIGSAVCYILLVGIVGLFMKRYGKLESLFSMAFLCINTTAFQAHMIRSGDADSLYVLMFTLAMLCMIKAKEKINYVYGCGLFFALAFLTKSFHSGVIVAIGFLYFLLCGIFKEMKMKQYAGFLASAFGPVLLWAFLRMRIDGTEFFIRMWQTDVMGRTDGTLTSNPAPFLYYASFFFGSMSQKVMPYLCALVICAIGFFVFAGKFTWKNREKWLGYLLWFVLPFFLFSLVSNKLLWYVYPCMIPLFMASGLMSARLIQKADYHKAVKAVAVLCLCFIIGFYVKEEVSMFGSLGKNEFQDLIVKAVQESGLRECWVMVEHDENNADWNQQDVFVAETAGDYKCMNGGIIMLSLRSAYSNRDGLIFVGNSVYDTKKEYYEDLQEVCQSENYRVFRIKY